MSRPVRYNIHPIEANIADSVTYVDAPEGYGGDGFFTTN
jgi:NADH-quinone oxidoreductase subunit B